MSRASVIYWTVLTHRACNFNLRQCSWTWMMCFRAYKSLRTVHHLSVNSVVQVKQLPQSLSRFCRRLHTHTHTTRATLFHQLIASTTHRAHEEKEGNEAAKINEESSRGSNLSLLVHSVPNASIASLNRRRWTERVVLLWVLDSNLDSKLECCI